MRLRRSHDRDRYDAVIEHYVERWRRPRRSFFIDLSSPLSSMEAGAIVVAAGLIWFAVETFIQH